MRKRQVSRMKFYLGQSGGQKISQTKRGATVVIVVVIFLSSFGI